MSDVKIFSYWTQDEIRWEHFWQIFTICNQILAWRPMPYHFLKAVSSSQSPNIMRISPPTIKKDIQQDICCIKCLALSCHTHRTWYVKYCISAGHHMLRQNNMPDIWWGSGHWAKEQPSTLAGKHWGYAQVHNPCKAHDRCLPVASESLLKHPWYKQWL